ncbi:hypothetical protein [Nocardia brasiliensis]|uniref:hypothetical protein n=1 Tax=Nocardia brasiliensis TaxID=37326 RepID=UPI0024586130|nr:hypothetical protein [Nocardia brasiliensis]
MESFTDFRAPAPAYRVRMDGSTVDIPNGNRGVVYFGEGDQRPELPYVEEIFPAHRELWIAVETAYWDAVQPLDRPRLADLAPSVIALDYSTDQWTVQEIREAVEKSLRVA